MRKGPRGRMRKGERERGEWGGRRERESKRQGEG